jgi:hypothetical protein
MRMQKHWKLLVIGLFLVTVIAALPIDVQATYRANYDYDDWDDDDDVGVFIEYADYLDNDNDGNEDDIITVFVILPPTDDDYDKWKGDVWVDCIIVMPSGKAFYYSFVVDIDDGVRITLSWLNCAQEEGWYFFGVEASPIGKYAPENGADKCIFDPPEGGLPAPPIINIVDIEKL